MTAENFCYWLKGIFEIQEAGLDRGEKRIPKLTESQIEMISDHLNYVFAPKIDYSVPPKPKDYAEIIASGSITDAKIC